MKQKLISLAQRYRVALGKCLSRTLPGSAQAGLEVGREALALGLDTLELARIHEQALVILQASGKNGRNPKADIFFSHALTPIVETHRASRQGKIKLQRLNKRLSGCTLQLANANLQLKRGVLRRKSVELALKKSGVHYSRLLKNSLHLQEELRQLTHQVLAGQEEERKKISCELQDEVAQSLLGINVRLVSLKQEARTNSTGLKNEIASTRQLVANSARSVRRVAREFRNA